MNELELDKLDKEIIKWHKKTFPDATLEGQLLKLHEEVDEYEKVHTLEDKTKELADVYIVAEALTRWGCSLGIKVFKYIFASYFGLCGKDAVDTIFKEVKNKMEINKKRIWKKTKDGVYHHEKESQ